MNQLESYKKINVKLSTDLEFIENAYSEIENLTQQITSNYSKKNYKIVTISYALWAKFSYPTGEEYEDFLKSHIEYANSGRFGSDIFFGREIENPNSEALHLIDRVNFYLKYLNNNFDVKVPSSLVSNSDEKEISITYTFFNPLQVIADLKAFTTRVEKMIKHLEEISILENGDLFEAVNNDWIKKISENRFDELIPEMISFYKSEGDIDKIKLITQISQRYYILKKDNQKGIRPQENLDSERNKISSALIDIIYER